MAFTCAAGIAWLAGHFLYGSPTETENYYFQQFNQAYESNKELYATQDSLIKTYSRIRDDPQQDSDLRRQAIRNIDEALGEQRSELAEQSVWLDKSSIEKNKRIAHRSKYNLASLICLGFATAFGLLFFITAPSKKT
ncbi:MAG TPA: hypothetical protein VGI63_02015 [Verrucomicrobiae bacterium]